jgi:hypothetical protein
MSRPRSTEARKTICLGPEHGKPFTIVGMVKDSKYGSLSEAPQPYFFMSFDQNSTRLHQPRILYHGSSQQRVQ